MQRFLNKDGKSVLLEMVKAIQDNKAYLGEVDGLIGDGDHGMNMNKGFTMFGERIADSEISFSDGLNELGMVLLNEIGGSMGPIYGTLFMEMADKIDGAEEIDVSLLADMLSAGMEGLFEIIDARQGDKTLVDTLYPSVNSLSESVKTEDDMGVALKKMKAAAEKGRDSTKDLAAKYGRSSRLGERSRGVLDAGATSCCLILCAMVDGILEII